MKNSPVKTIVAIGVGAALFFVLGRFVSIPSPGHNNYIMNELGVGYRMIDADHDGPDAPAGHEENA